MNLQTTIAGTYMFSMHVQSKGTDSGHIFIKKEWCWNLCCLGFSRWWLGHFGLQRSDPSRPWRQGQGHRRQQLSSRNYLKSQRFQRNPHLRWLKTDFQTRENWFKIISSRQKCFGTWFFADLFIYSNKKHLTNDLSSVQLMSFEFFPFWSELKFVKWGKGKVTSSNRP